VTLQMKLLLHLCCGPCGTAVAHELLGESVDLTGIYYNPNVHPSMENFYRRQAAYLSARSAGFPMVDVPGYEYREFLRAVVGHEDPDERCPVCYRMRFERVADVARERGFDAFTTSLLISPHQRHDVIKAVAEAVAEEKGVEFVYRDFRDLWEQTYEYSRKMDLYRQKYCGCIYSEEERFHDKTSRLECT